MTKKKNTCGCAARYILFPYLSLGTGYFFRLGPPGQYHTTIFLSNSERSKRQLTWWEKNTQNTMANKNKTNRSLYFMNVGWNKQNKNMFFCLKDFGFPVLGAGSIVRVTAGELGETGSSRPKKRMKSEMDIRASDVCYYTPFPRGHFVCPPPPPVRATIFFAPRVNVDAFFFFF